MLPFRCKLDEREVRFLLYLDQQQKKEFTQEQLGEMLGTSANTIRSSIRRAKLAKIPPLSFVAYKKLKNNITLNKEHDNSIKDDTIDFP